MCHRIHIVVVGEIHLLVIRDLHIASLWVDRREHAVLKPRLHQVPHILVDIELEHNLDHLVPVIDAGEASDGL